MALVTVDQAISRLKLEDPDRYDLELILEQATAFVLLYIKQPTGHGWTSDTNPATDLEFAIVQNAILLVVGDMVRHGGDEAVDWRESGDAGVFAKPAVRRWLTLLRPLTIA